MPSNHPARSAVNGPSLAQLNDVLHAAFGVMSAALLGLVLGLAAARLMRRGELHWSWALLAFGVILLARGALGGLGGALVLGAACTALRCRRWHREDLRAGGDLAAAALGRRTPLSLLRRLGWRLNERQGRSARASRRDALVLGRDDSWRPVAVPFGGAGGGTHTLVVGATGSGKTVTQCRIAVAAIERGMGAVVVDPKGDRLLREQLAAAAVRAARPMLEWTPAGPSVYNPFARGSETEIADKALAGERFTEPHYLRQAQRYLGHAVRALRAAGEQISLRALVEMLDPSCLESLARSLEPSSAEATYAYLDSLSSRQRSDLAGVRDRLAVLAESEVGSWLDPRTPSGEHLDLLRCVRSRAVVLFRLQADSRPLLSQMLAAAIVQDLQTVVAASQEHPVRTLVLIDEFSAIAPEHVVRLFGRSRSAGVSLVLGTQEISDLRPSGRERLLEQVMGNLSLLIAHRQVVPASAEMVASLAGARGTWKVTHHSGGATTRTRARQPRLDPDRIMGLGTGWAAVITLGHLHDARLARIASDHALARRAPVTAIDPDPTSKGAHQP